MSYVARSYIRLEWDAQIKEVKTKIQKLLQRKDLKFEPQWEANWAALVKQANKRNSELSRFKLFDGLWEREFPEVMRKYYEGLAFNLQKLKFGEDEMLREGFNEAVETGRIVFRIVEELDDLEDGYGAAIEDGVMYMQVSSTPRRLRPPSVILSLMAKVLTLRPWRSACPTSGTGCRATGPRISSTCCRSGVHKEGVSGLRLGCG